MIRNMGSADRYLRAIIGVGILLLWATGLVEGALAVGLGVIAAIFLATSVVGFCPLYAPFHISTRRRRA